MGWFGRMFGAPSPEAAERKEARRRAQADELLQRALGKDPDAAGRTARVKAAIDLVLFRHYELGILAYQSIAEQYPADRGNCLYQIGTCLHLLGRLEEAIASYEDAIAHGMDPAIVADNLQAARQARRDALRD